METIKRRISNFDVRIEFFDVCRSAYFKVIPNMNGFGYRLMTTMIIYLTPKETHILITVCLYKLGVR